MSLLNGIIFSPLGFTSCIEAVLPVSLALAEHVNFPQGQFGSEPYTFACVNVSSPELAVWTGAFNAPQVTPMGPNTP